MGAGTSSQQRLGARVMGGRKKLEADKAMQAARVAQLQAACPETLEVVVRSVADSFLRCAPFSDSLLLVAFAANPEETQRILSKSCKKVLGSPIRKADYDWFKVRVKVTKNYFCTCEMECVMDRSTCFRRASG